MLDITPDTSSLGGTRSSLNLQAPPRQQNQQQQQPVRTTQQGRGMLLEVTPLETDDLMSAGHNLAPQQVNNTVGGLQRANLNRSLMPLTPEAGAIVKEWQPEIPPVVALAAARRASEQHGGGAELQVTPDTTSSGAHNNNPMLPVHQPPVLSVGGMLQLDAASTTTSGNNNMNQNASQELSDAVRRQLARNDSLRDPPPPAPTQLARRGTALPGSAVAGAPLLEVTPPSQSLDISSSDVVVFKQGAAAPRQHYQQQQPPPGYAAVRQPQNKALDVSSEETESSAAVSFPNRNQQQQQQQQSSPPPNRPSTAAAAAGAAAAAAATDNKTLEAQRMTSTNSGNPPLLSFAQSSFNLGNSTFALPANAGAASSAAPAPAPVSASSPAAASERKQKKTRQVILDEANTSAGDWLSKLDTKNNFFDQSATMNKSKSSNATASPQQSQRPPPVRAFEVSELTVTAGDSVSDLFAVAPQQSSIRAPGSPRQGAGGASTRAVAASSPTAAQPQPIGRAGSALMITSSSVDVSPQQRPVISTVGSPAGSPHVTRSAPQQLSKNNNPLQQHHLAAAATVTRRRVSVTEDDEAMTIGGKLVDGGALRVEPLQDEGELATSSSGRGGVVGGADEEEASSVLDEQQKQQQQRQLDAKNAARLEQEKHHTQERTALEAAERLKRGHSISGPFDRELLWIFAQEQLARNFLLSRNALIIEQNRLRSVLQTTAASSAAQRRQLFESDERGGRRAVCNAEESICQSHLQPWIRAIRLSWMSRQLFDQEAKQRSSIVDSEYPASHNALSHTAAQLFARDEVDKFCRATEPAARRVVVDAEQNERRTKLNSFAASGTDRLARERMLQFHQRGADTLANEESNDRSKLNRELRDYIVTSKLQGALPNEEQLARRKIEQEQVTVAFTNNEFHVHAADLSHRGNSVSLINQHEKFLRRVTNEHAALLSRMTAVEEEQRAVSQYLAMAIVNEANNRKSIDIQQQSEINSIAKRFDKLTKLFREQRASRVALCNTAFTTVSNEQLEYLLLCERVQRACITIHYLRLEMREDRTRREHLVQSERFERELLFRRKQTDKFLQRYQQWRDEITEEEQTESHKLFTVLLNFASTAIPNHWMHREQIERTALWAEFQRGRIPLSETAHRRYVVVAQERAARQTLERVALLQRAVREKRVLFVIPEAEARVDISTGHVAAELHFEEQRARLKIATTAFKTFTEEIHCVTLFELWKDIAKQQVMRDEALAFREMQVMHWMRGVQQECLAGQREIVEHHTRSRAQLEATLLPLLVKTQKKAMLFAAVEHEIRRDYFSKLWQPKLFALQRQQLERREYDVCRVAGIEADGHRFFECEALCLFQRISSIERDHERETQRLRREQVVHRESFARLELEHKLFEAHRTTLQQIVASVDSVSDARLEFISVERQRAVQSTRLSSWPRFGSDAFSSVAALDEAEEEELLRLHSGNREHNSDKAIRCRAAAEIAVLRRRRVISPKRGAGSAASSNEISTRLHKHAMSFPLVSTTMTTNCSSNSAAAVSLMRIDGAAADIRSTQRFSHDENRSRCAVELQQSLLRERFVAGFALLLMQSIETQTRTGIAVAQQAEFLEMAENGRRQQIEVDARDALLLRIMLPTLTNNIISTIPSAITHFVFNDSKQYLRSDELIFRAEITALHNNQRNNRIAATHEAALCRRAVSAVLALHAAGGRLLALNASNFLCMSSWCGSNAASNASSSFIGHPDSVRRLAIELNKRCSGIDVRSLLLTLSEQQLVDSAVCYCALAESGTVTPLSRLWKMTLTQQRDLLAESVAALSDRTADEVMFEKSSALALVQIAANETTLLSCEASTPMPLQLIPECCFDSLWNGAPRNLSTKATVIRREAAAVTTAAGNAVEDHEVHSRAHVAQLEREARDALLLMFSRDEDSVNSDAMRQRYLRERMELENECRRQRRDAIEALRFDEYLALGRYRLTNVWQSVGRTKIEADEREIRGAFAQQMSREGQQLVAMLVCSPSSKARRGVHDVVETPIANDLDQEADEQEQLVAAANTPSIFSHEVRRPAASPRGPLNATRRRWLEQRIQLAERNNSSIKQNDDEVDASKKQQQQQHQQQAALFGTPPPTPMRPASSSSAVAVGGATSAAGGHFATPAQQPRPSTASRPLFPSPPPPASSSSSSGAFAGVPNSARVAQMLRRAQLL